MKAIEREDAPHKINGPIDLPQTIISVGNGDVSALESLFRYIQPHVRKTVSRKVFGGDVDDLTQTTLMNVLKQIPNFNLPKRGKDTKRNFYGWVNAITNGTIAGYYKQIEQDPLPVADLGNNDADDTQADAGLDINQEVVKRKPFPGERSVDIYPSDSEERLPILPETLRSILPTILSSRETNLVISRMKGSKLSQLMSDTGLTKSQIVASLNQAREKIEDNYLYPAGFRKITEFVHGDYASLISAAIKGRLRAAFYLGRWYTMEQWVREYKFSRRKSNILKRNLANPTTETTIPHRISYQFPMDIIKRNLVNGFREWFFTSARYASKEKIPFRRRRLLFEDGDYPNIHEQIFTDLQFWMKQGNIEFSSSQLRILRLKILGNTPEIIGKELNYSEAQIVEFITHIRTKIEEELFKPNGIMPIYLSTNNKRLRDAARHGYLPSAFIIGRWYMSEDKVSL